MDKQAGDRMCSPEDLSPLERLKWNVLGTISLIVGVIGVFLPIMPTAPFVLVAAACYLRGSRKLYHWLISNRFFGKIVNDYSTGKGISLSMKLLTTAFIWGSLAFSFLFFHLPPLVLPAIMLVGAAVSWYIWRLPVRSP